MHASSEPRQPPAVSIILPTYNRAGFLPQAIESIRAQTWMDWELIIVDDGSTDGTADLIRTLTAQLPQVARYVYQQNQGAYAARNTGLNLARGKYIAFFDSDDSWLPHHLGDCVQALEANPDVDWVYGACRIVDEVTGQVLAPTTFYVNGIARPFLRLRTRASGPLRTIDDRAAVVCMIWHGLYNGLQNSVIRGSVFEGLRFEAGSRNEAEDQLFVIRALKESRQIAYLDHVHVIYRVHAGNSSAVQGDVEKRKRVFKLLIAGFERLADEVSLTPGERRILRRRLSREYFWHLGYTLLWVNGQRREALRMFRRGLAYWPWDWRCWKTYGLAVVKTLFTADREAGVRLPQGERGCDQYVH
jgi:glycosyltransferase involved in cell wall biosynthesis